MTLTARAASILLLAAVASPARAQSEPLGRLFFTPEQRTILDRQRRIGIQPGVTAAEEGASYTVNGIVKRSSGSQTTWVNGTPLDGAVRLDSHGTPIRAGETVRADTGEREDVLNGGRIIVEPAPRSKRDNK